MHFDELVNENVWWDVARKCDYATFFHTPIWTKLALNTYPNYKDSTLHARIGNEVNIVLPIIELRGIRGYFRDLMSTFAGCYGDIIADGPVDEIDRIEIYKSCLSFNTVRLRIIGNPLNKPIELVDDYRIRRDYTHIIKLNSDFQSIFNKFSKGHRSSFKRGIRLGVTVRNSKGINDFKEYYKAYEDSLVRWGDKASSFYPWRFFEVCSALSMIYPENIKLWIAELDGRLIAGALVFYWGQHADWWHGASYEKYFEYYPNNVLQTTIVKDAIERGYAYYDFNPSGDHKGVSKFKSSFGAMKSPFYDLSIEHKLFGLLRNIWGVYKKYQ